MPNTTIQGFEVGGTTYQYDYDYLANKPASLPSVSNSFGDIGKVLVVGSNNVPEWANATTIPITTSSGMVLATGSDALPRWITASDLASLLGA